MLAQEEQFLTQFIFQLLPVMGHRDLKIAQQILTVEHTIALLHVAELYGEYVGGRNKFLRSNHQRRMVPLATPPGHHAGNLGQLWKRHIGHQAE